MILSDRSADFFQDMFCDGAHSGVPARIGEPMNIGTLTATACTVVAAASFVQPALSDEAWKANLNADQVAQMEIALQRGQSKARNCFTVVGLPVQGDVGVDVVFDGQKGRITDVTVRPPYADAASASCIKRAFVGEIIVPFDGPSRKATLVFAPSVPR
jgi:hypothetical protein